MDPGLASRHAQVRGASKGLGPACARSLAREGGAVTRVARGAAALDAAAEPIRQAAGVAVFTVAADLTTPVVPAAAPAACPAPDILVTHAGGPRAPRLPRSGPRRLDRRTRRRHAHADRARRRDDRQPDRAGFITGRRLLMDGGHHPGTF